MLALAFAMLAGCARETFDIGQEDHEAALKKCTSLAQRKHYEKAVECLEIFKSRFPQTQQGQEAELKIADTYYNQGEYLLAADTYLSFIKLFPAHAQVDYALYRTGLSYLKEAPKAIDRDQTYLVKAAEQFQTALRAAPNSPYREAIIRDLEVANDRLAKRIFYIGHFYYRTEEYISASLRFEELVNVYPKSPLVPRALFLIAKTNLDLGRKEEARRAVEMLLREHPDTRWTNKAQGMYLKFAKK
ncbi:MAG: outer membrane protein assembly factor BamD [bacterium]|nr:outer membrane protein assembly factor BamD [bacterium]